MNSQVQQIAFYFIRLRVKTEQNITQIESETHCRGPRNEFINNIHDIVDCHSELEFRLKKNTHTHSHI